MVPMSRRVVVGAGMMAMATALAACGSGGSSGDGDQVEISFLTQNSANNVASAEALIEAFETANPDIQVTLQTQPAGTEGDNLMKTKLGTGEMESVFYYNSGSLLQALNPDQTLVALDDEEWVDSLIDPMRQAVSTENGVYGAPFGASQAGAVMYNKPIYEELGLEIPTTWDEFIANAQAVKDAGRTGIIQTYGDTWTSQLFVLGDFANVSAQDADWAQGYTSGERKYVDEPALEGFANQQAAYEADLFNQDFASALFDDGVRMLATGEGAHYPILTGAISTIAQNYADNLDDVGVFPLPAKNAADTKLTVWMPNAFYIPTTTEGAELEAAKTFVAFANSSEGCEIQAGLQVPSGPFATSLCSMPADVPAMVTEMQPYFDSGQTGLALEFLSPIKGPNLENITVQVGSGISTASEGAALYDEDVVKQAKQLGLEGW